MCPELTFLLSNYPGSFQMMPLSIKLRNREMLFIIPYRIHALGVPRQATCIRILLCPAGGDFHPAQSWGFFLFPEETLGNHQDTNPGCYPCDNLAELTLGIIFSLLLLLFQCSENFQGIFFVLFTSGTFLYLFCVAQVFWNLQFYEIVLVRSRLLRLTVKMPNFRATYESHCALSVSLNNSVTGTDRLPSV